MVKNLPLLIVILLLGISSSTLSTNGYFSPVIEGSLMIISITLNITAVIGLSLHVLVYQPMKRFETNLKETCK
ncbi:hypothetical protein ICM_06575 [Bacillus cereus BAG1X2-3]|uniref:Uncharacterized protein n=1 Tax=Bacillus cereus TaxID=1396 RepID=A0A9X7DZR9_BACCE|nr:hypothetical protein [Bacillus cereus]EOO24838.1 hypothetical protein ICC_05077 [Bacillus cereus BAG1X1-1]EOO44579.1 hypothetical protein ICI_05383 [Bacillus cereus BAG1X2-1]EOO46405.1 hypothetical protein ICK_05437 [Bacillus cereus BAG1X2-2]EOO62664.1 hypothetical protein ICM_06575 [Bacillus cereus BAG1X2-3]EOP01515.1 hypothetical protein ICO_05472 [Bacillus cereus BAG2O-1]